MFFDKILILIADLLSLHQIFIRLFSKHLVYYVLYQLCSIEVLRWSRFFDKKSEIFKVHFSFLDSLRFSNVNKLGSDGQTIDFCW